MSLAEAWRDDAACVGKLDLFFPGRAGQVTNYDAARKVCASCPAIDQCRAYAVAIVASGERLHGCWAGTDEAERRVLAKRPVVRRLRGVSF